MLDRDATARDSITVIGVGDSGLVGAIGLARIGLVDADPAATGTVHLGSIDGKISEGLVQAAQVAPTG
jgi:hypothetical protein